MISSIPNDNRNPIFIQQAIGSKSYREVNKDTSNEKPVEKVLFTVAVIKYDYSTLSAVNNAMS